MVSMELRKGQILGPVEDSDQSCMFSSVKIKHPVTGEPAWVNVWTRENNLKEPKGICFCLLISASKAERKQQKKEAKQNALGVSFPVDLDSEDDDFEAVAAETEIITEVKEALGMSGSDDPLLMVSAGDTATSSSPFPKTGTQGQPAVMAPPSVISGINVPVPEDAEINTAPEPGAPLQDVNEAAGDLEGTRVVLTCSFCEFDNRIGRRVCACCWRVLFHETADEALAKQYDLQDIVCPNEGYWITKPGIGRKRARCDQIVERCWTKPRKMDTRASWNISSTTNGFASGKCWRASPVPILEIWTQWP